MRVEGGSETTKPIHSIKPGTAVRHTGSGLVGIVATGLDGQRVFVTADAGAAQTLDYVRETFVEYPNAKLVLDW